MVGNMIKATESGLGAFADMTEMFTKYLFLISRWIVLMLVLFRHLHAIPMDMLVSRLRAPLLLLLFSLFMSYQPGWLLGV